MAARRGTSRTRRRSPTRRSSRLRIRAWLKIAHGTQRQLEKTQADLEETKTSLGKTQTDLEKTAADLEAVRGELRSVLVELESIARDLRRFVEWEEAGAQGSPPIALTDIYARLEALTRKRPHP